MIDLQQISLALSLATRRSLLVIDEFGKGTGSSGTSIDLSSFWSLLKFLRRCGPCLRRFRIPFEFGMWAPKSYRSNSFSWYRSCRSSRLSPADVKEKFSKTVISILTHTWLLATWRCVLIQKRQRLRTKSPTCTSEWEPRWCGRLST